MEFFHNPHFWIVLVALLLGVAVAFAVRLIVTYYARRKGSKFADAFVRKRAGEIVAESKLWDGKFWNLQVTEATDRTIRLRVLATAASAEAAWDMRCEIRERLVEYLQKAHPWALPRIRTSSVETAAAVA